MSTQEARIDAIVALDDLFEDYQVAVSLEEALALARRLPALGKAVPIAIESLVREINAAVPRLAFGVTDPNTGCAGHTYHIGRRRGRLLVTEVLEKYLPPEFKPAALFEMIGDLAKRHSCAHVEWKSDDTTVTIRMQWD